MKLPPRLAWAGWGRGTALDGSPVAIDLTPADEASRIVLQTFSAVPSGFVGRVVKEAIARGGAEEVRSLRLDGHERNRDCWLHDRVFCLSQRRP